MKTKQLLLHLLEKAKILGANENDMKDVAEMLNFGDFHLCLDTIVSQMYEHNLAIDEDFYQQVVVITAKLSLNIEKYDYIKHLVKKP
jgi:hypothetical protein